jgi:exosortase
VGFLQGGYLTYVISPNKDREMNSRQLSPLFVIAFLGACLLPFALAWGSLRNLAALVLENDTFSQIPLIPAVSFFLIYTNRRRIFSCLSFGWVWGPALMVPGVIFIWAVRLNFWQLTAAQQGSLIVFGMVLFWMGTFAFFFGTSPFRAALFPLLFLLFTVPIPEPILSGVIYFLQKESSEAAELFFRLVGVPYLRQGFIFALPGVTIRVAEECSGIRSTLALLITSLLASHALLQSNWKRALVCLFVIPLSILKNGMRIVTLSTLAIYVNPGFLYGNLHHHGGIVFFLLGLVPLVLLVKWLQKTEQKIPLPICSDEMIQA